MISLLIVQMTHEASILGKKHLSDNKRKRENGEEESERERGGEKEGEREGERK